MASKVLQKVGAALYGGIEIEALDTPCRAGNEPVGLGKNHGRPVISLN